MYRYTYIYIYIYVYILCIKYLSKPLIHSRNYFRKRRRISKNIHHLFFSVTPLTHCSAVSLTMLSPYSVIQNSRGREYRETVRLISPKSVLVPESSSFGRILHYRITTNTTCMQSCLHITCFMMHVFY